MADVISVNGTYTVHHSRQRKWSWD